MTEKLSVKDVENYFKQLHEQGEQINEEVIESLVDKSKFSKPELKEIEHFLQELELSDNELESVINWYGKDHAEEEDLEEEIEDLEPVESDSEDEEEEILDDSATYIEEGGDDDDAMIKDLQENYADNSAMKSTDPVKMYLKEIGRVPLLKPEEERRIAYTIHGDPDILMAIEADYKQIEELKLQQETLGAEPGHEKEIAKLDKQIAKLNQQIDELNAKNEEYRKTPEFAAASQQAKDALTSANLRLVVAIAKKYVGRGLQFLDLIQEGNMGLVKAVEKFEPMKGFKFSTYATWWIRQAITRAIADQARTIRIPVHMVETINKLTRVQRQLVQELGRDPTAEEISERMDGALSPEKVRDIQKISMDPVSLETPIGEEDDSHLGDFIEDKNSLSPDEYATQQMLKDEINNVLQLLTPRERKVLQLRFGLVDGRTRTLEEVGKEFNVTRERIRQIEAKALRKLKHPTKNKRLKDFVDKE